MAPDAIASATTHPDFQPTKDTDLLVQSSDGVQFHLHIKHLSSHTGAFPTNDFILASGSSASGENAYDITHLTESAEVLAILFGFVYPKRQPSLKKLGYEVMGPLAEAVEKYEVFSAMVVCEMRLRELVSQYPAQILAHGIKHDYPDLVDAATPFYSRKSLGEVATILPPNLIPAWCRYRDAWDQCFKIVIKDMCSVYSFGTNGYLVKKDLISCIIQWQEHDNLNTLRDAIQESPPAIRGKCQYCDRQMTIGSRFPSAEVEEIAKMLREKLEKIPPFTSFL